MTTRPRTDSPTATTLTLTGPGFVEEVAKRQGKLLQQMVESVQAGALRVKSDETTDRYIEGLIADWTRQEQPTLDEHLAMLGAVFTWAFLDLLEPPDDVEDHTPRQGVSAAELALEALRTAAAIWGKR